MARLRTPIEPDSDGGVRRVRHPLRIIVFTIVVLVLIAVAFLAGQTIKGPNDVALQNANRDVEVLAAAEERVVDAGFALPGQLVPAPTEALYVLEASVQAPAKANSLDTGKTASTQAGDEASDALVSAQDTTNNNAPAERIVVSKIAVSVGQPVSPGTLLAEVSGRPLFAWPSDAPFFRNLTIGDVGSDVAGVQQTLSGMGYYSGPVDGEFGAGTLEALSALYRDQSYTLPYVAPGVSGFAWREVAAISGQWGTVIATAVAGQALDADHPLLVVQTSDAYLSALATTLELPSITVGAEVGVAVSGAPPVRSVVLAAGNFVHDEESGASGYPVTIQLPAELPIAESDTLVIRAWQQAAPSLAIPAIAVRQEGAQQYVLVPNGTDNGGKTTFMRVPVQVLAQNDGWVSIAEGSKLEVGTEVLVSDEPS